MTSFANKIALDARAASSSNFVLSLFAACSSAFSAVGKDGKDILTEQISELLGDHLMALSELKLRYSCRFGFTVGDALTFIGFNGSFHEFAENQNCFVISNGCIRHLAGQSAGTSDAVLESASICEKPLHKMSSASTDDTASTTDAGGSGLEGESDVESAGSTIQVPWKLLGSRLAAAFNSDDEEEDFVIAHVAKKHNDAPVNPQAWSQVGRRLVAACKQAADDEHSYDADISDIESSDDECNPAGWSNVGSRIVAVLGNIAEDDMQVTVSTKLSDHEIVDPAGWQNVGSRFAAACKRVQAESENVGV